MSPALDVSGQDMIRAQIDGRIYQCVIDDGGLTILNEHGDELSATSAQVVMSLGGTEPGWLTTIEALTEAFEAARGSPRQAVQAAASALEEKGARRAELARTTFDVAIVVALAAVGTTQVGANPACTIRAWDLLMKSRDPSVRRNALRNNEVLPPSLWQYPEDETQVRVARNPLCPENVLHSLAIREPEIVAVRNAVASNTQTPDSLLTLLAADADMSVRRSVANNPSCPTHCFKKLSRDRYAAVRTAIITNPAMPVNLIARRIRFDPTPAVHIALASRADLKPKNLVWLERYSRSDPVSQYRMTCARISDNPASSEKLRRRIGVKEAHLESLSQENLKTLETTRVQRAQNLPPGILATTLLVMTAIALGGGFVAGGIGAMHLSTGHSVGSGLPLVIVGVIVAVVFLLLARRKYRKSPAWRMISPPRVPTLSVPFALGTVVLLGIGVGALSTIQLQDLRPAVLIVVIIGLAARFGRRRVRSSKSTLRT